MLRDITLGQYYRTESVIHNLDPRVKLVATLVFIISLFVSNNFIGYLIAGLFLVLVIYLSKVPPKFIFRGMKTIFFLLFITMIFNLFLTFLIFTLKNKLTKQIPYSHRARLYRFFIAAKWTLRFSYAVVAVRMITALTVSGRNHYFIAN